MTIQKPISLSTLFVDGAARFRDLVYIVAKDRSLNDKDVAHSRFIAFYQSNFCHNGDRNWSAVAVCVAQQPAEKMIAVGHDGEVFTYVGGGATDERILPEPMALRNLGVIDGFPYACGMNREVFRRDAENSWTPMHAPGSDETSGFEAIDGFISNEIYAVGWKGEIWEWNGKTWTPHAALTNLILTGVCCAGNQHVYACGQNGTLIVGRHDIWKQIDLNDFSTDFWDMHWFGDKLYIATMQKLYTYDGSNGLTPVDFGPDAPSSCYRLSSAEGVLWSVGYDDVFSFDGQQWTRVD
jgi:hypothetical protein